MTIPTLLCTVRSCRHPLERRDARYVCANHHSFDVSRSGYVNLLQPQDRRSRSPGDSGEAAAARRRFLEAGHAESITRGIVAAAQLDDPETLLDVGCGEGHHVAAFRQGRRLVTCGVDISVPAVDLAARRDADTLWVVANADRFIPWADHAFDLVTSITARMNPPEFRRVLGPHGRAVVAIPGADDLIELRQAVLGDALERDRIERTAELFASDFTLEALVRLRQPARLDRRAIADVLSTSYRGLRRNERARVEALQEMDVTLSRDVLVFRPLAGG